MPTAGSDCRGVTCGAGGPADEDDEEEGKLPGIKTHTFDGMDVRARPRARCGPPAHRPRRSLPDLAHAARSPALHWQRPAGCHPVTPNVRVLRRRAACPAM